MSEVYGYKYCPSELMYLVHDKKMYVWLSGPDEWTLKRRFGFVGDFSTYEFETVDEAIFELRRHPEYQRVDKLTFLIQHRVALEKTIKELK